MEYLELDRLIECIPYREAIKVTGLDKVMGLDGKTLFYGTVADFRRTSLDDDVLIADVLRVEIEFDDNGIPYLAIEVYC